MVAIIVRVEEEVSLPREERAGLARGLRLALEPFRPRVARAALRIRRGGAGVDGKWRVEVSVPLGPGGLVRVEARDVRLRSTADAAIRRAADAVARRLSLERRELLEFLFLACDGASGWPAAAGMVHRRARAPSAPATTRRAAGPDRRATRGAPPRAAARRVSRKPTGSADLE
jgi:hypothetical protein